MNRQRFTALLIFLSVMILATANYSYSSDNLSKANIFMFPKSHPVGEMTFATPSGKPLSTNDLRGKVVLLQFWSIQCQACRMEEPLLEQLKKTNGLTRLSDDSEKNILPQVTKLSFIPIVTIGGGNYARPQLRLVYTAAFQNDDTKALYNKDDIRSQRSVLHYFGLSAEWWFNVGHR